MNAESHDVHICTHRIKRKIVIMPSPEIISLSLVSMTSTDVDAQGLVPVGSRTGDLRL